VYVEIDGRNKATNKRLLMFMVVFYFTVPHSLQGCLASMVDVFLLSTKLPLSIKLSEN